MPEATIEMVDGIQVIRCGNFRLEGKWLTGYVRDGSWHATISLTDKYLDDLYAVLHARHMAQHYDSELIARIEKAVESVKEDELYGGE